MGMTQQRLLMGIAVPRIHKDIKEDPSARGQQPLYELLARGSTEAHKNSTSFCYCYSCPPELDNKTLLLKTPCSLRNRVKFSWE